MIKKRFSWRIVFFVAILHFMSVIFLLFIVFMQAFGRMFAGMGVFFAGRRMARAPEPSAAEFALNVLVFPLMVVERMFGRLDVGNAVWIILFLNSLLWGIIFAGVAALFRKPTPPEPQQHPMSLDEVQDVLPPLPSPQKKPNLS